MNRIPSVLTLFFFIAFIFSACTDIDPKKTVAEENNLLITIPDTSKIPNDEFGKMVGYGRSLLVNTAYLIGPEGINGRYTLNKMNCSNCHQEAGTKPFSLNLVMSHTRYPQYRAREAKVLTLAERINNCIERPHNGRPLPYDSKEMIAILSYLKWINEQAAKGSLKGDQNLEITFPDRAADPAAGKIVYESHCTRCHGSNGEGIIVKGQASYTYPLLWGDNSYQPGSSMHRVIKMARWLKANMPYDSARWDKPLLTDEQALDVAAFVNDDRIHSRPSPKNFDFPNPIEKSIDYGRGPFADTFSEAQHKFGPYKPIIDYWKKKGWKPGY